MSQAIPRIIGLTGGIACGKSTVSEYLERHHHCTILDADLYAKKAVSPPSPLLARIQDRYGAEIIDQDGRLNREKLGQIIFNDASERQWVEGLIHPFVREQLETECQRSLHPQPSSKSMPIVVLDIPLLFESKMDDLVTEIWVVSCLQFQQQQRLMKRNQLSIAQANARIQSQWPLAEKIKRASVVLNNTGDREYLYCQIDRAIR